MVEILIATAVVADVLKILYWLILAGVPVATVVLGLVYVRAIQSGVSDIITTVHGLSERLLRKAKPSGRTIENVKLLNDVVFGSTDDGDYTPADYREDDLEGDGDPGQESNLPLIDWVLAAIRNATTHYGDTCNAIYQEDWVLDPSKFYQKDQLFSPFLKHRFSIRPIVTILGMGVFASAILFFLQPFIEATATVGQAYFGIFPLLVSFLLAILVWGTQISQVRDIDLALGDFQQTLLQILPVFEPLTGDNMVVNSLKAHEKNFQNSMEMISRKLEHFMDEEFRDSLNRTISESMRQNVYPTMEKFVDLTRETNQMIDRRQTDAMKALVDLFSGQLTETLTESLQPFMTQIAHHDEVSGHLTENLQGANENLNAFIQTTRVNIEEIKTQTQETLSKFTEDTAITLQGYQENMLQTTEINQGQIKDFTAGMQATIDEFVHKTNDTLTLFVTHSEETVADQVDKTTVTINDLSTVTNNILDRFAETNRDIAASRKDLNADVTELKNNFALLADVSRTITAAYTGEKTQLREVMLTLDKTMTDSTDQIRQMISRVEKTLIKVGELQDQVKSMGDTTKLSMEEASNSFNKSTGQLVKASQDFSVKGTEILADTAHSLDNITADVLERLAFSATTLREAVDELSNAFNSARFHGNQGEGKR